MKENKHKGLPDLPKGKASKNVIEGCAVLEGGAFRGVYSQGVLDALMENDINMQCVIGVSAGALNGMNYVSGDIGRSIRMILNYRHDPRYVGLLPYFTDSGVIGFDFMFYNVPRSLKFSYDRFFDSSKRYACVTTSCETGEPVIFERGKCEDIFDAIQASASMPYFSKPVSVEGKPYLDGGCSLNDPWQWAKDQGYDKVLLIRNRPAGYRKVSKSDKLASIYAKKYPRLAEVLSNKSELYNSECEMCEKAHESGDVFMLCPGTTESVSRLEKDLERLELFYWLGYYETIEKLPQIKAYLGVN